MRLCIAIAKSSFFYLAARHGQQQAGFVNPWVPPKNNFEDNQLRYTSALSRGHSAGSRGLDDSSPAMASSSIWGDFGSPHGKQYCKLSVYYDSCHI
jgi:hypothetical protein